MTGAQVREARRLLGWSADRVNGLAGLPSGVTERFERTNDISLQKSIGAPEDRLAAIRAALEKGGVEFVDEVGGRPGVRLRVSE